MGILIELGLFLGFIAFGFWQLHDVKKAQADRLARKQASEQTQAESIDETTEARE
jgi:hypothetical protein